MQKAQSLDELAEEIEAHEERHDGPAGALEGGVVAVLAVDHEEVVAVLRLFALVEAAHARAHLVSNLAQNLLLVLNLPLRRLLLHFPGKHSPKDIVFCRFDCTGKKCDQTFCNLNVTEPTTTLRSPFWGLFTDEYAYPRKYSSFFIQTLPNLDH